MRPTSLTEAPLINSLIKVIPMSPARPLPSQNRPPLLVSWFLRKKRFLLNPKLKKGIIVRLPLLVLSILLSGCASVSIVSVSENRHLKPATTPSTILSKDISTLPSQDSLGGGTRYLDSGNGHINSGKSAPPVKSKTSQRITTALDTSWKKLLVKNPSLKSSPEQQMLVTAQTWKEDVGSRLTRTVLGLGAGRSRLDAKFYVFNLKKSTRVPWLTIHTSGGSNREPGVIFSLAPSPYLPLNIINWTAVATSSIMHGFKGLDQDASRTGKMVSLCIWEHLPNKSLQSAPLAKTKGHVSWLPLGPRFKIPFSPVYQTGLDASRTIFIDDR